MLFLQNRTYVIWPIELLHFRWPWIHSCLKMRFVQYQSIIWQDINWHAWNKGATTGMYWKDDPDPKIWIDFTIYVAFVVDVYPRDPMLAPVLAMALCLSVCHKSGFYRNGWTNRAGLAWELPSTHATLCYKKIRVSVKIKVLLEFMSQTLDCKNLSRYVDCFARERWTPKAW